ncbi:hypothetical protein [Sphingobium sp.]|nr:hypothetical protein [Sphingobium sp.]HUD95826.1 hypothetical protein [Sphingobium sp.]
MVEIAVISRTAVRETNGRSGGAFDLAGDIRREGVPFLFITGYDQDVMPR